MAESHQEEAIGDEAHENETSINRQNGRKWNTQDERMIY